MRKTNNTKGNRAAKVVKKKPGARLRPKPPYPKIVCKAPDDPSKVTVLDNYLLKIKFYDGLEGFVFMNKSMDGVGGYSVLKDPKKFRKVFIKYGAVSWPGNIDLNPDRMREEIEKHGIWVIDSVC